MAKLSTFPALHRLEGRSVLLVGDGPRLAGRLALLAEFDVPTALVCPTSDRAVAVPPAKPQVTWIRCAFDPADVAGRALAFAASDDDAVNARVAEAARRARVPVNVADHPALCDFDVPAIVNRAPVVVAIGSAGAAPVLAQRIRARIDGSLSPRLGRVAIIAAGLRGTVSHALRQPGRRRAFWRWFIDGPAAGAILAGDEATGRRLALEALNATTAASRAAPGCVWVVDGNPGAADLMTLRAQRVLGDADVIVHDPGVPDAIAAMARREAVRVEPDDCADVLVEHARAGRHVVWLTAADAPSTSERAALDALRAAHIAFEIVPAVSTGSRGAKASGPAMAA